MGDLILKHDNNYHFVASKVIDTFKGGIPSASVIIPYFESRKTINCCLEYLFESINFVKKQYKEWKVEVTVIDDGSVNFPARKFIKKSLFKHINLIVQPENKGITEARNTGLSNSKNQLAIYMDSDIILPKDLLLNHLKLQGFCQTKKQSCISFSLFNFTDMEEWHKSSNKERFFKTNNDFREKCLYEDTWIGYEDDKKFIGNKFTILETTKYLSDWPKSGQFGPWCLANMVLGGFFTVDRGKAIEINGCSPYFGKYGFVETSLVTKVLAKFDDFIIPVIKSHAVHLFNKQASFDKSKRDLLFRKAHDLYFNHYLKFDLIKVINEKI